MFRRLRTVSAAVPLSLLLAMAVGCARFKHETHEMVYVSAAHPVFLHDRVAAVSNRVGQVSNGQALEVLERSKRFVKVKTENNEIGWIEERAVIDAKIYDSFAQMAQKHKDDPVAASATLRDDMAMHLKPGRDTERFYLLAGNSKVSLLSRASVVKKTTAEAAALQASGAAPTAPDMEDWWLIRDTQGRVGWLLGKGLDVDVPDEVAQYAEGQRIVGAWILTKVTDEEATTPDHQVAEYLTVMAPPKSGLPFDYDQVRVFTWSIKHHRYETAFRLHPIQGFLPVLLSTVKTNNGTAPAFSFAIANGSDIATDPETGITRPASLRTIHYEMLDTRVQRIGPDMGPIPIQHEEGDKKPGDKKPAKKSKR
jgi:hypothetical protein